MLGTLRKMEYCTQHALHIEYHSASFTGIPGKGKVIADCVITTTPIAFIFTRYCLFLMFCRFIQMTENLLSKMHIEGALMSKSHNIALTCYLSIKNKLLEIQNLGSQSYHI